MKRIYDFDNDEFKFVEEQENKYCHKIIDNLYLGSYEARVDPRFTAIVTLVSPHEFNYISKTHPIPIDHTNSVLVIPIYDAGDDKIAPYLKVGIDFIKEHIKDKKVLVHCMAGISRSTSLVIAYLIDSGMTMPEAYWHIRDRRDFINPYPGFMKEIMEFFKERLQQQTSDQSYLLKLN